MQNMPEKYVFFNFSKSRDYAYCKTLKIHKKYVTTFSKTWYTYVSKGALSIGAIKFWGKVAEGGSDLFSREKLPNFGLGK